MMRVTWQPKRFDECATLVHDAMDPTGISGSPYIGLEHIGESTLSLLSVGRSDDVSSVKSRFRARDILFGKLRPYFRKVVRPTFGGICSTDIWVVRPTEEVDPGFLFYWMASQEFVDASMRGSEGTRMPRAQWDFVSRLTRPLPSLIEQRAIASVLEALDDKIDLNRRRAETLEETARVLFKSWFVDFDPVQARAEGRRQLGLDAHTAGLFPNTLLQSSIGKIPSGWQVAGLGTVVDTSREGVEPGAVQASTPYVGLEHMPRRSLALGLWGKAGAVTSGKLRFKRCDILFGKLRPYFHKVVIAPVDGVCSTDILVITPHESYYGFALGHFSSDRLVSHADRTSRGTKMPRATWNDLAASQVAIPPEQVAAAYSRVARDAADRILASVVESRMLAELRDYLLPRLLSGETRVVVAEKVVEAAL